MKVDLHNFKEISSPYYILEEERLRANLSLIQRVASEAGIEIILAFKAYALWKTFPIFREYIQATTASSLYEARLAFEEFGNMAHTYSPAYTDGEIREIASMSSHLTFNSLTQYQRYQEVAREVNPKISLALRINPEYSEVGTDLYNPCAPGTRFGVTHDKLADTLPPFIEGFHCHCHCESGSDVFERTLVHIEEKFSKWFPQLKWINFGGGHLMTRKDYDVPRLIRLMKDFRSRYPWLHVILEPGSAFGWQTGPLVAQVVDVVEDRGIQTAIVNVSFTCHMPDCLEMPYMPAIRGAETIEHSPLTIDHSEESQSPIVNVKCSMKNVYRIGGNSCLSGDFMGFWRFDHELQVGENIIFEDMLHYTTVKTCMFNGIGHPSIAIVHPNGEMETLRQYTYEDYRDRMD
ncbi:MAG: carboxynorspermidine decarboxylase [Prevotella sp.]|nr:carboxynorspermidine decarboxylase [Prevotella sp.]